MKKKIMMGICAMMLILFVGHITGLAMSFSELYRNAGIMAFLSTGERLFACQNKTDQTCELVCTAADGQTLWNVEIPRALYGDGKLGLSGDDIAYVYRTEEGLFVNRYSRTGAHLATVALPQDAGMYIPVNGNVYFISERKIQYYDAKGQVIQIPTEKDGRYRSLYEVEGNGSDVVVHVSVEGVKTDEHELIAFDSNHQKRWTYSLTDYDFLTSGRTHLAVSIDGCTSFAILPPENHALNVTALDDKGTELWTREIELPLGKGGFISHIRRDAEGTTWIWGATQTSTSDTDSANSWRVVADSEGNLVERAIYPKQIDFFPYLDGAIYGIKDPFGVPVLCKEGEIDWIIR